NSATRRRQPPRSPKSVAMPGGSASSRPKTSRAARSANCRLSKFLAAIGVEHQKTQRARQIAGTFRVGGGDQAGERLLAPPCDLLKRRPKFFFQRHAGRMACDFYGTLLNHVVGPSDAGRRASARLGFARLRSRGRGRGPAFG